MDSNERLQQLLSDMDVPLKRKAGWNMSDLWWLQRNLGIRNSEHSGYREAVRLIAELLRHEKNRY